MTSLLGHVALTLYIDAFAPNREGYVRNSRVHVDAPITPELCEQAFAEGFSVSAYLDLPIEDERRTNTGAIDFDEGTLDDGRVTHEVLRQHGIEALLVESRRGCHLWAFAKGWMPSAVMRGALTGAAGLAGLSGPKVEVFPKHSSARWSGALRMPLMPHPKTGIKYPAIVGTERIDKVVDLVNHVATLTAPVEAFTRLAGDTRPPAEYPRSLGDYRKPSRAVAGATVTTLLDGLGVQARPGRTIKCPFHPDKHASLSIAFDDTRAFCKAPECPVAYGDGRGIGSLMLARHIEGTHAQ